MTDHTATDTPPTAPALGAQVDRGVRPQRTEWREIADALKLEYGERRTRHGVPYFSFERHVYVGRAGALLLQAEKQEATAATEIEALKLAEEGAKEAFGHVVQQKQDAEAECSRLRELLDAAYAHARQLARDGLGA